jgi:neutral trehalase
LEEAEFFEKKAIKTEKAILTKMYDEESETFYSLDARQGKDEKIEVLTISSLMPLILDSIGESQVESIVEKHLLNPEEFWTNYPIPANPLNLSDEEVNGHVVWRGDQTWPFTNWFIVKGLRKQALRFPEHYEEYNEIADEITARTYQLIVNKGFREYYDSETGKGGGAKNFGASTLILDISY